MHRILLVDDEPHVLSALKRVLRAGFGDAVKVEAESNPRQALVRASEVVFDLVVSDFRMPEMDGVHFLERLRALQPHAVRMMLSASTEVQTVMRALNDVEVHRFICKPWQEDELIQHVAEALARSSQAREERDLADQMRLQRGQLSPGELELRRLEAIEPGLTQVDWGPNGEVLMPFELPDLDDEALKERPADRHKI